MSILSPINLFYAYLLAINLVTFFIFGADKLMARVNAWRVSERALIILALLGGSPGALLAMKIFHHKTIKPSFQIFMALVLVIQLALVTLLFHNQLFANNPLTTPVDSLY